MDYVTPAHGSEVVALHVIKICPDQISFQDKNSRDGNESAVFISFSNFLRAFFSFSVQTQLNNDIFIKTVEIVREN